MTLKFNEENAGNLIVLVGLMHKQCGDWNASQKVETERGVGNSLFGTQALWSVKWTDKRSS